MKTGDGKLRGPRIFPRRGYIFPSINRHQPVLLLINKGLNALESFVTYRFVPSLIHRSSGDMFSGVIYEFSSKRRNGEKS